MIVTPPQGEHPQNAQIIKKDFSFDENEDISLRIRTTVPGASLPIDDPFRLTREVTSPTPKEPFSAISPLPHGAPPVELKSQPAQAASPGVNGSAPEVTLPVSNFNWQTKTVKERKVGGGRRLKQVDVFTPGTNEQHESSLASTSSEMAAIESFLGPTSATTVVTAPFGAAVFSEYTVPSFLSTFPTTQKPAFSPRPVVRLPGMGTNTGSKPNMPKRELGFQSPALASEQQPVVSAPKRVRRSMVKLVKPESPQVLPPKLSQSLLETIDDPAEYEVEKTPKLEATQDTNEVVNSVTEATVLEDVEPASIDQLRHRFLDTSILKEVPAGKPQQPPRTDQLHHSFSDSSILGDIPSEKPQRRLLDISVLKGIPNDEPQHTLIDTSFFEETPAEKPQNLYSPVIKPISPEELAREALAIAFREREAARVELSKNYSPESVDLFSEKAQEYKAKRKAPELLTSSGQLSSEDEASFPYLSSRDTEEPQVGDDACSIAHSPTNPREQVASPVVSEPQRPLPLPSPPSTSDEDDGQHVSRGDPEALIAKASRAYQLLLGFTKNMKTECPSCNSKFCLNAYSDAGQRKMKIVKELYQESRSEVMDDYEPGQAPDSLTKQLPEVEGC